MQSSQVIEMNPSRFEWVDDEFRQWVRRRIEAKDDAGPRDVFIALEDEAIAVGIRWVQSMAAGVVRMSNDRAFEVFSLVVVYGKVDHIPPRETLGQALCACRRRDASPRRVDPCSN